MNLNNILISSLVLGTYVVSAIPFGLLVAKAKGVDLRKVGSGNIGATNVYRALGKKYAAVVFLLDSIKGAIPVWLAMQLFESEWLHITIAALAIGGHSLSCFVNFKGGKGAATAIGVMLALSPPITVVIICIAVILIYFSGYVSLTTIACAAITPLLFYIFKYPLTYTYSFAVIAAFIIYRHKSNIGRLLKGQEHKIK